MSRNLWILALLPLAAACSNGGNTSTAPSKGACAPTCAGGAGGARYADYAAARKAFTRSSPDGVLNATLEDAAWLKFEGDPDTVEARHRAYFEYGYTAFQVVLRAKAFTRPSEETFVLEDGRGERVTGKPITFTGGMQTVDDRWQYTFELAFKHALGADAKWLRLTRVADGESVEWSFGG